jgi:4-diphosphocytidyl-2-C-methyl-D-erythritol kinase
VKLQLRAPAKLNLTLEVLGRRGDGFHEVRGVMQTIGLYDNVQVGPAAALELLAPAETGPNEDNLAIRAARRLACTTATRAGARIELVKQIPVSAGLGGGSSDAAATLRLLDRLWATSQTAPQLRSLAAELGSDVPFFLEGSTAEVSGRGERVELLPAAPTFWTVLVCPDWSLSEKTARVYGAVEACDFGDGARTASLVARLRGGKPPRQMDLINGLQPAALRRFPELGRLIAQLESASGVQFIVSGAGPTLFHLAANPDRARQVAAGAVGLGATVRVVRSVGNACRIQRR